MSSTLTLFPSSLTADQKAELAKLATNARTKIIAMTTLANSGHPGGSMSSIDILLTLYKCANISPKNFSDPARDNIVVSIGHISPAVYTALASNGFFPMDDAVSQFRLAGSIYEGHIERTVNGVEWTTGNLGQGLSAACGFALGAKVNGIEKNVFVLMGDGEQQKGQISEARRFAIKHELNNIIAFIDYNKLQISGAISSVIPQNIAEEYAADGWYVQSIDGHDYSAIAAAVLNAQKSGKPSVILANTIMGKGVSFMENKAAYHGSPLPEADYIKAMAELGAEPELERYKALRAKFNPKDAVHKIPVAHVTTANWAGKFYAASEKTDCRSAFGNAITYITESSYGDKTPVIVFDCDLKGSIKTQDVEKKFSERFIQSGISEHNAATVAGAASAAGVIPFFTTFTMFAVDEVYNQLRMNDINGSNMKVASTHSGVDVGEDGRTHQAIDYLGLMRNMFTFKTIFPADPNQTDHAVRYATETYGNILVAMGRSKLPVITDADGNPFFGEAYQFEYGKVDTIRSGDVPLIAFGGMVYRALEIREILKGKVDLAVYNAATPVHPDKDMILKLASRSSKMFVYEDHISATGLYASICEIIASAGIACKVIPFGVPKYAYSGSPDAVFDLLGLSPNKVAARILQEI